MFDLAAPPPRVATNEGDSRRLIADDLHALITRIERSMRLIDAAMMEADALDTCLVSGNPAGSTGIVVLDDVTPRYVTANAALNACRAGLGYALQDLSESGNPV